MTSTLNRRRFLACTGAALASAGPLSALQTKVKPKILLAYASKCGSTLEVAQAIARDLESRGQAVDLFKAEKTTRVAGYDAVIVGSAVRFGKWLPDAVDFVRLRQTELKRLPTAFFSVHMMNTGTDDASRKARLAYTQPVRTLVSPGSEAFFAGKMDMGKLSFTERLLCKVMKGRNEDRRDWPAIHAWAAGLFA